MFSLGILNASEMQERCAKIDRDKNTEDSAIKPVVNKGKYADSVDLFVSKLTNWYENRVSISSGLSHTTKNK